MAIDMLDTIAMGGGATVTGLPTPVGSTDAAPKDWVTSQISAATPTTEAIQDVIGALLADSATLDFTYNDAGNVESAAVLDSPQLQGHDSAFHLARANHTGTQSADTLTDGTTNKAFLATERTKLTGIATGATANDTDANLKARANHTGTQLAATISDFATAAVAAANAGTIDADTLGGSTAAQLQTATIAAIVASAPTTLDTLIELATALGNDPNFATTMATALALRVQSFAATIGDGSATSIDVTHNLGTRDVQVQLYDAATPWSQKWCTVTRPTINKVTLTFAAAPATNALRAVVMGRA